MEAAAKMRRGYDKSRISRVRNYVATHPLGTLDVGVEHYQTRLDELISAYADFNDRHNDLIIYIEADNAEQEKAHEDYFLPVEESFLDSKTKLLRFISSMTASVSMNETAGNTSVGSILQSTLRTPSVEIRLPPLLLPSFSGDYSDWTSFLDIFSSSINANVNLSDAQKLQYLKSSLKGEALNLIQHFAITNAN